MEKKDVVKIVFFLAIGFAIGFLIAKFTASPGNIDIDCLIDIAEKANLTEVSKQYSQGVIDETWSIKNIDLFYWNKYPKSRWAIKVAAYYYLKKCEE